MFEILIAMVFSLLMGVLIGLLIGWNSKKNDIDALKEINHLNEKRLIAKDILIESQRELILQQRKYIDFLKIGEEDESI